MFEVSLLQLCQIRPASSSTALQQIRGKPLKTPRLSEGVAGNVSGTRGATAVLEVQSSISRKEIAKLMNLIRYHAPDATSWPALDRWSNLRDELDSFFDLPFSSSFGRAGQLFTGWSPALDLYESGDHLVAVVELPGMTVSGERKRESTNGEKAQRTERYVGTFRRSISLPTRVDAGKVTATYQDGILKVTLPKAEEAKPKQIHVS
jgi:HSP20 family protein